MERWREQARHMVRLAPGRPAVKLGVRTAIATVAPLVLAPWITPAAVAWAVLGGFTVSLADKGGSYGTRARTMGGVTLGAALAVAVATPAGAHTLAAVPLMLVWATLCGFSGVLGPAAAAPGVTVAVVFSVALASPAPGDGVVRALGILGGGTTAMLLALLLWPIRVYQPARFALARCYRALGRQCDERQRLVGHAAMRTAIETARAVLAATRRGRFAESGRGARLLVLLQVADLIFASLIALEEVLEHAEPALAGGIRAALAGIATTLEQIAERVESERRLPPAAPTTWGLAATGGEHAHHAATLVERIRGFAQVALETTATLYDQDALGPAWVAPPGGDSERPRLLERVREHLTLDSALARHALRVGVTAAAATAITRAVGLERGYWVTVTIVIVLQPYTPATMTKALQRVAGTVLGGIVAALLVAVLHDVRAIVITVGVLAGVSAAILQLNYVLYSFLLTPCFVLLAEMNVQDWHLAELRIANTLLGGALAFAGARLLWPHAEQRRFPEEMAGALAALAGYAREVVRVLIMQVPPPAPTLTEARRRLGLALNGAEASFQRLLAERAASPARQEAIMTLLLYTRRVSATLGAIASTRTIAPARPHAAVLERLGASVDATLADLADAVRTGRVPAPLPAMEELAHGIDSALIASRVARLAQQLTVLREAVVRVRQ